MQSKYLIDIAIKLKRIAIYFIKKIAIFLYDRKVLLSYYIKKGVVGDEIPCLFSGRCSDSFAVVEGNLGFPSESVVDAIFLDKLDIYDNNYRLMGIIFHKHVII